MRSDSPPPPSVERQVEVLTQLQSDPDNSTSTAQSDAQESDLSGSWVINTNIEGLDERENSFGGYRVTEELFSVGVTDAVGTSPAISGELNIQNISESSIRITDTQIRIDLRELTSDRPNRDNEVQDALNTSQHPFANFELTQPIELEIPEGESSAKIVVAGNFTVNGVTRPVTVEIEAQLVRNVAEAGDVIVVAGEFDIEFEDYEISPPSARIVVSVEDKIKVELLCNFTRAN